jgi:pimeloyl-ACP methyl ester carboxylesterase
MDDLFDRAHLRLLEIRGYRRHTVETSAGKVHAISARGLGERPVVVLHGLASASHHYENVLESARPYASHVVGVDLLGHGGSDRPVVPSFGELERALLTSVDSVLDRLGETQPAVVFGNSLGGAAAVRYAHRRPERVAGLFLVAPGGAPMSTDERDALLRRFTMRSHGEALAFVDGLFDRPHPLRHVLAWGTRRRFADPALRSLLDAHAEVDVLSEHEVASLRMPLHVIWGGADKVLPESGRLFFERSLPPDGTLEVVPHFGHVPQFDHADEVMGRLRAFAGRAAPARAPSFAPALVT